MFTSVWGGRHFGSWDIPMNKTSKVMTLRECTFLRGWEWADKKQMRKYQLIGSAMITIN